MESLDVPGPTVKTDTLRRLMTNELILPPSYHETADGARPIKLHGRPNIVIFVVGRAPIADHDFKAEHLAYVA